MNYKRGFIETFGVIILGLSLLVGGGVAYKIFKDKSSQVNVGAAFSPVSGGTYRLQSSIGTSNTSITLSSFKEPVSNIPLTMAYMNTDIMYATIDPQTAYKELISFTGVTQNADGTATLTGVSRGLGFSYPYTASSTLAQSHSGQSILILSNAPQLYNQYAAKGANETITGQWSFNNILPVSNLIATTSTQFVTKQYADGLAIAGVSTSTESSFGGVWLASQVQMASSTYDINSPRALYSRYATSSPYTTGLWIPITQNNGKLHQSFLDLTQNYTWTGSNINTGLNSFSATSTFATTTQNGAMFGSNIVNSFIGGQTISGATTPQPVMLATSTNQISLIESDVASTTASLLGFVINNCSLGTTCYVQTDGIVKGFSGLTPGSEYYVSDTAGVLSTTVGSSENYVGRAVSTSAIQIDKTREDQYLGNQVLYGGSNAINSGLWYWWRKAVINVNCDAVSGQGTIYRRGGGLTTFSIISIEGAAPNFQKGVSVSFSGNTISLADTGNVCTAAGTAYFYK